MELLSRNLAKAQLRMKTLADNHRREVSYEVDSWVYVKLQPYRQISLTGVKYNKLHKRYYCPYRIVARIGPVAYKLELPSNAKIHNVFHCSLLKPHAGPAPTSIVELPPDSVENHPVVTPLTILDSRTVTVDGLPQQQVLVQWTGLPPEETSWENWKELHKLYNLEDKVGFEGVDIDANTRNEGVTNTSNTNGPVAVNTKDQPITSNMRPQRLKKAPGKLKDHILYK